MSAKSVVTPVSPSPPAKPVQKIASKGLTSDEAHALLEKDGPNAMPDTSNQFGGHGGTPDHCA
jgi:hypothetical protein